MPAPETPAFDTDRLGRSQRFHDLMRFRVHDILLVSSLYDSFILSEDGQLSELLLGEFLDLNLHHTPGLTRVSTGEEALERLRTGHSFNLIVTSLHPGDMDAGELARFFLSQKAASKTHINLEIGRQRTFLCWATPRCSTRGPSFRHSFPRTA